LRYKYIFLLLLSSIIFSQSEYKISAEGFTFGKPVGNTVKLTIFLSASNVGSFEEFSGQLRNIKLISKKYSTGNYLLEEYKRIIDNDKNINGYVVFSLSYSVPIDANDISLQLPEIYGSLIIPITYENYTQWAEKGNNAERNAVKNESKTNFITKLTRYLGIGFGMGGANTFFKQSLWTFLVDVSAYPKLFSFGKDDRFTIGASFSWTPNSYAGGDPENDLFKYYGYNRSVDTVIHHKDKATMYSYFIGGGLGISAKYGSTIPALIINYGHYSNSSTNFDVRNKISGYSSSGYNSFSGTSWKIDFLISYQKYSNFKYSFVYGDFKTKGIVRGHFFTIGIGGF
jgi:hypothetical protein